MQATHCVLNKMARVSFYKQDYIDQETCMTRVVTPKDKNISAAAQLINRSTQHINQIL